MLENGFGATNHGKQTGCLDCFWSRCNHGLNPGSTRLRLRRRCGVLGAGRGGLRARGAHGSGGEAAEAALGALPRLG